MTLSERYDHLVNLVSSLRALEIKESKLRKAGGYLPKQDRDQMYRIQQQIDRALILYKPQPKLIQNNIFNQE